ncbi:tRNA pseudouridine(38-40) synthase TruA [Taylorella equigenitalis]|uniref:tRNA pseudouridine synthase A n=3 Tax=Taylorella equigenitalis TaxID=29575 RepID=A0A654KIW1_TAYEM|nr:tRNA pseudouridine(38-40) synthase TruA [Taylorella equigenitalis]ADU92393.1 tRNA pseudouridine synthase A [Taylorella equigenitalis MCE9]AFN35947.1 tRNA pseudouridine synthase A [Taylorella equigenitalis ATCC 35865]ASY30581.1 tRNA pseudouridine(38-40) synthase TruA [Taylorella equigenitalis]ASY37888.1 tRNA pseudouridine(38-40) synthase TruA [Taylorella equigenitalis]ASY39356.1 tRNA pseudouridine(38-40) synthase TruA [Taylorella equigenitalis]
MSYRVALGISYDGRDFQGWQTQPNGLTVQDKLEAALREFTRHQVSTICAGRTDTGVHALGQVVHFDTEVDRNLESWIRGVNSHLPDSIRVRWSKIVPDSFSARFSAVSRTYVYLLRNERVMSPIWSGRAGWDFHNLDVESMNIAKEKMIGTHDFTSFRSSQCQASSPVRTLDLFKINAEGPFIIFTLRANGFLHHMVRNLIGTILYVGMGRFSPSKIPDLIEAKNRMFTAPTFMPDGLYFARVDYPEEYEIPQLFDIESPFRSLIHAI